MGKLFGGLLGGGIKSLSPVGALLDHNPAGTPQSRADRKALTAANLAPGSESSYFRRRGAGSSILGGNDPLNINAPSSTTLR